MLRDGGTRKADLSSHRGTWSMEGGGDGPYSHPFHCNEIHLQVVGIERANLASLRVLKQ